MFSLLKKHRAKEALFRGTKAVLIGGFFHAEDTEGFKLTEEAASWLYTEALAHQIYALIIIFNNTLANRHAWATPEFAVRAIDEAIKDHEIDEGSVPGTISSFIFRRCTEMDALSPEERLSGEQFRQSARKIKEIDPTVNSEQITKKLESVTTEYFNLAVKMFEK